MSGPFAARWEVTSYLWSHGSFVEAGKVRPLGAIDGSPRELWVERMLPSLTVAQRARVWRRWYLASRLESRRWPQLLDAGEENNRPWAVMEGPGLRPEGTFPAVDVERGLAEVRAIALAVAEAEGLLERVFTRAGLGLRPVTLARAPGERLMLQLAALDTTPDEGFHTPAEWSLVTPEELWGHPPTARTNVFVLGWLLSLVLTGKAPYELAPGADGQPAPLTRESLAPLVLSGRVRTMGLAEAKKPAEAVLRRALAPLPGARYSGAAAFAEALEALAPVSGEERPRSSVVPMAAPAWPVSEEQLPAALEASLLQHLDVAGEWLELAERLDDAHGRRSVRAALVRAHHTVDSPTATPREKTDARVALETLLKAPGLTPHLDGEKLGLGWRLGYVRMVAARPDGEVPPDAEAHVLALMGLLQHPSLRFMQLVSLNGPLPHAHRWVQALQRQPPPALRRVHITAVPQTDAYALDIAYRFPRWTWTWGKGSRGSLWTRLFSPRS